MLKNLAILPLQQVKHLRSNDVLSFYLYLNSLFSFSRFECTLLNIKSIKSLCTDWKSCDESHNTVQCTYITNYNSCSAGFLLEDVNVPEKIQIFKNFLKILKIMVETWFFYWIVKKSCTFYAKNRTNLSQKLPISQWFTFRTANFFKKSFFFEYLENRSRYFYISKSSEFVKV